MSRPSEPVRVYAGKDPATGSRRDLVETIPAGPRAARLAEEARTRLLIQVDERRHPRTAATVNQLLDQHLDLSIWERSTRDTYVGYIDRPVAKIAVVGAANVAEMAARELAEDVLAKVDLTRRIAEIADELVFSGRFGVPPPNRDHEGSDSRDSDGDQADPPTSKSLSIE